MECLFVCIGARSQYFSNIIKKKVCEFVDAFQLGILIRKNKLIICICQGNEASK